MYVYHTVVCTFRMNEIKLNRWSYVYWNIYILYPILVSYANIKNDIRLKVYWRRSCGNFINMRVSNFFWRYQWIKWIRIWCHVHRATVVKVHRQFGLDSYTWTPTRLKDINSFPHLTRRPAKRSIAWQYTLVSYRKTSKMYKTVSEHRQMFSNETTGTLSEVY